MHAGALARIPARRAGQGTAPYAGCPPRPLFGPEALSCDPDAANYLCGCRVYALIFDSGVDIGVGAVVPLVARPQKPFRGQLLVIPSTIGPFFTIQPPVIGTDPQSVNAQGGQLLAQSMSEVAVNNWGNFDSTTAGVDVTLTVTNIGLIARRFFAYIWGTVYKQG